MAFLKNGDKCRRCESDISLKESPFKIAKLTKSYFYFASLKCYSCGTIYLQERFKIVNKNPLSREKAEELRQEFQYLGDKKFKGSSEIFSRKPIKSREEILERRRLRKLKKNKNKKLQPKDYDNYINSKAWQNKRLEVLSRTPFCFCCTVKANHIHHRTYKRLGIEKLNDLVALCSSCHMGVHGLVDDESVPEAKLFNAHQIYKELINIRV